MRVGDVTCCVGVVEVPDDLRLGDLLLEVLWLPEDLRVAEELRLVDDLRLPDEARLPEERSTSQ